MSQTTKPDLAASPDELPPAENPAATLDKTKNNPRATIIKICIPIVVSLVLAFVVPHPEGLSTRAWYYFAIFVGVIIGVAIEVLPMGAFGLIGVCVIAVLGLYGKLEDATDPTTYAQATGSGTLTWALSGFSNSVVWIVFAAMIFAVALKNSGIGKRIALILIRLMGKTALGLGYAFCTADLVLGPFMPSNTARSFGTIYPIARATSEALDSHPDSKSAGKVGSFLMFTSFVCTFISSSTFLTAAAMTILGVEFISKASGLPPLSWMAYLYGYIPQAIIMFILTPLIAYKFFKPTVTKFPEAPVWAHGQLKEMGRLTRKEIITLAVFVMALVGWIFLNQTIPTTMTALIAVSLLLMTRVIDWEQVLAEKSAWNIVVVLATLITLATGLGDVGFLNWVSHASADLMVHLGLSVVLIIVVLIVIDYLLHYMYVSITAHVTTLMPLWLAVVAAIPGFPVQLFGIVMIHTKEGYGALTPYGAGHGVGYMLSGYFPEHKQFWKAQSAWAYTYLALMLISIPYWVLIYGWV
ncbi:MAG: anion permease [Propionibacteriaceae bacterium]|nr:anion permease [Propionibacteriaceae bacterium]